MHTEYSDKYKDYSWIKVKRFECKEGMSVEDKFEALKKHHIEETKFLIDEIRSLAAKLDNYQDMLDEYQRF